MNKIAFITEPRRHKALKFVLENFLSVLPVEWKIQINHGTQNLDYIKQIMDQMDSGRIILRDLGVENLTHQDESDLLRTEKFWEEIDGDILLKFECDTMLCPDSEYTVDQFEYYDYIGGHWGQDLYPLNRPYPKSKPMNGALSIRNRDVMINIIRDHYDEYNMEDRPYSEDYFFSEYIQKPSARDVITFSIDNGYIAPLDGKAPFGVHKPWGGSPHKGHGVGYNQIKLVCPEVEILRDLQGVEK